jgi:hypothetical protein
MVTVMTMVEPMVKQPNHDDAVAELCKLLINSVIKESADTYGDSPRERLTNHVKQRSDDSMMGALSAFSTYLLAKATDRQASATEAMVKTVARLEPPATVDTTAQAMVELREPKRDYLATTYSLPPRLLTLLWAVRGMLVDASLRSLSKPEQFNPYEKVTTAEIAWSLRMAPEDFLADLPRTADSQIDYGLLEDFDIVHYDGTVDAPDGWMYGG